MTSPPDNDPLSLSLPTLQIDWRCGSVVMHHGAESWQGQLPMTAADCSQINTARGTCQLAKIDSVSSLEPAVSSGSEGGEQ